MPRNRAEVVVISWRDIPAQVNARDGHERHQVLLPARFQRAVERATRVAGKKTSHEHVAEWRRRSFPIDGDALGGGSHGGGPPRRRLPARPPEVADRRGWVGPGQHVPLMTETAESVSGPVVVFVPSGRRGNVPAGTTVLDAARQLGVDLDSVCGGRGICGRCQVRPAFGEFAKHALTSSPDHLSSPGSTEHDYHGRRPLDAGSRLGCAAQIVGDVVLDVPPESQVHRPVVRKSVDLEGLVVDPVVRLHYLEVAAADLGEGRSDLQLLLDALDEQWSLTEPGGRRGPAARPAAGAR